MDDDRPIPMHGTTRRHWHVGLHVRLHGLAALTAIILGVGCREASASGREPRFEVTGGSVDSGKVAIDRYGCGSCHSIPGIRDARGMVGPPLTAWGRRTYIAGEVPNTPDYLIRWIQVPQAIEPGTVMPNLGVPEQDARNIAAYLYTLR
jgi:cytochrome c2